MGLKRIAAFVVMALVALGALASQAAASAVVLRSTLGGTRSLPLGGDPDGTGGAFVLVDDDTNRVCTVLWARNIAPSTGAHIHVGAEGQTGGHAIDLIPPTRGTSFTCAVASESVVDQLIANPDGFYVNIHNADYPDGAIRGQLEAV